MTGQAWQVELKDFLLDDGRLHLHDAAPAAARSAAPPEVVRIDVDQLRVAVQGVQLHGSRLQSKPRVKLAARIVPEADKDSGRAIRPGRVDWDGRVGVEPLAVRGSARIEHFPVHAVQAYVSHDLGLRLAHAEAGFRGDVALQQSGDAAPSGDIAGDLLLSDLLLLARPGTAQRNSDDRELLSWQSFAVNGMNLTLRPGALPKLVIADATLSDFFARLILAEDGALNLRDVAPRPAAGAASAPLGAAAVPAASAASAAPGQPPPAGAGQLPVVLDLGGLKFVDGRVAFTDRFVTPNYSAALTELNGRIGAFRTGSGEPATLQLSGRAAGTGLLEISGRINPGTVPRELDITARASDIELAPLSTYAGKYAGYAIERGKLSVEVHYRIEPDGKLDASHQVILNQLTFGERVESPTATKLPVLLAVALLKDKDGVIDINLPVGGTVSDPQFSVGAIIWKVIVNLLTKAVTAPFTLLAGGGGHDISVVEFEPGTSLPTPSGATTIDKVAKALADRPALKMTVTGQADPETEREAYQRAVVEQRLLLEQRREQLRTSGKAAQADAAQTIAGADRPRLVKAVYQQTELPDKPRNAIGLKADIAPAEMEALLRKHVQVSPEAMRELALQRGLAVRDALAATGLASERLFLGVPKLRGGDANEAAWSPQVKLDLSTK